MILRVLYFLHLNTHPSPNFNVSETRRHLNRLKGLADFWASAWVGMCLALFGHVKMQLCDYSITYLNFKFRSLIVFKK